MTCQCGVGFFSGDSGADRPLACTCSAHETHDVEMMGAKASSNDSHEMLSDEASTCPACLEAVGAPAAEKMVSVTPDEPVQGRAMRNVAWRKMCASLSRRCALEGPTVPVSMPCGHLMHAQCLLRTLLETDRAACPSCRRDVLGAECPPHTDAYAFPDEHREIGIGGGMLQGHGGSDDLRHSNESVRADPCERVDPCTACACCGALCVMSMLAIWIDCTT